MSRTPLLRPGRSRRLGWLLAAAVAQAITLGSCKDREWSEAAMVTGGDPARGRGLIARYDCGSCHTIPGVSGAHALVGPPRTGIGRRAYVAGILPNTPDNLVRWIEHPPAMDPLTAMPELGVRPSDARDIAAYFYTLR